MKRTGSAIWSGDLKTGTGMVSTQSGVLSDSRYGFNTRFADGPGTNPEELIGAAHAGCFSMALSGVLGEHDLLADRIATTATVSLDQVRTMAGPPLHTIGSTTRRLSAAAVKIGKVTPPPDLQAGHALLRSAWELAGNALRLRSESVSINSTDLARRASSAAAGAVMLYHRARADLATAMAPPSPR